jgi:hypothetical protein
MTDGEEASLLIRHRRSTETPLAFVPRHTRRDTGRHLADIGGTLARAHPGSDRATRTSLEPRFYMGTFTYCRHHIRDALVTTNTPNTPTALTTMSSIMLPPHHPPESPRTSIRCLSFRTHLCHPTAANQVARGRKIFSDGQLVQPRLTSCPPANMTGASQPSVKPVNLRSSSISTADRTDQPNPETTSGDASRTTLSPHSRERQENLIL